MSPTKYHGNIKSRVLSRTPIEPQSENSETGPTRAHQNPEGLVSQQTSTHIEPTLAPAPHRVQIPGSAHAETWWYRGAKFFNSVTIQTFWSGRTRAGQVTGPAKLANMNHDLDADIHSKPFWQKISDATMGLRAGRVQRDLSIRIRKIIDEAFGRLPLIEGVRATHVMSRLFEDPDLCKNYWNAAEIKQQMQGLLPPSAEMVYGINRLMSDQPVHAWAFSQICFDVQNDLKLNPQGRLIDWNILQSHCRRKDHSMIRGDTQADFLKDTQRLGSSEQIEHDLLDQSAVEPAPSQEMINQHEHENRLFQSQATLSVLEKCAHLPDSYFEYFAQKLGFTSNAITPLRCYLQMRALIRADRDVGGVLIDIENKPPMIERVFTESRAKLLEQAAELSCYELDISSSEAMAASESEPAPSVVDAYFASQGYTSDEEINDIRQRIFDLMDDIHHGRGIAPNFSEFGLCGADRQLLSTEKACLLSMKGDKRLEAVVMKLETLEQTLRQSLGLSSLFNQPRRESVGHSDEAQNAAQDFDPFSDRSADMLIDLILLQTWKSQNLEKLDFSEMVHGRFLCADQNMKQDSDFKFLVEHILDGFKRRYVDWCGEHKLQDFEGDIKKKLSQRKMGVGDLGNFLGKYKVKTSEEEVCFLLDARNFLYGKSNVPMHKENHEQAMGECLSNLKKNIYFANSITSSGRKVVSGSPHRVSLNFKVSENKVATVQGGVRLEKARAYIFRSGALNHAVEPLMLGKAVIDTKGFTLGGDFGWVTNKLLTLSLRAMFGTAVSLLCEINIFNGLIIRAPRRVLEDAAEPVNPVCEQNDNQIRADSIRVMEIIFEGAKDAYDVARKERAFRKIIAYCHQHQLSLSKICEETRSTSYKLSGRGTLAPEGGTSRVGVRARAGITLDYEAGPQTYRHTETRGSFRMQQVRSGRSSRVGTSMPTGLNIVGGSQFLQFSYPFFADLLSFYGVAGESSLGVSCRTVFDHGLLVPERSFLDILVRDIPMLEKVLFGNEKKIWNEICEKEAFKLMRTEPFVWTKAFKRKQAEKTMYQCLAELKTVRMQNHGYYPRARLHPDAADRLNKINMCLKVMNPAMTPLSIVNELRRFQHQVLDHDQFITFTSLIGDESVKSRHASPSLNVLGVGFQLVSENQGQREFIFQSPGEAWLRQWACEHPLVFKPLRSFNE